MYCIAKTPKNYPIFSVKSIQAWEQRWFAQGNSSFGLMQQASLLIANGIEQFLLQQYAYHQYQNVRILLCCGVGNNGGDGYLTACYLSQKGFDVQIFAVAEPVTADAQRAKLQAIQQNIAFITQLTPHFDVYIDALFGIGLDRTLSAQDQQIVQCLNQYRAIKIALDVPSGLQADTGVALPIAVRADATFTVLGLKMGLCTGQGRSYAGQIFQIPLIPQDDDVQPLAWLNSQAPQIFARSAHAHKGDFGHVLIVGGHQNMGGAVMMAAEAAIACGAGKVTVMCHRQHHQAILSRSPNVMLKDIDDCHDTASFAEFLQQIDSIAFGMGLGRDAWALHIYQTCMAQFQHYIKANAQRRLILDADALYFLAQTELSSTQQLNTQVILTPHSAEAGRLLAQSAAMIEQDRVAAIAALQQKYGGQWVLKGAGTLCLAKQSAPCSLSVCAFGNAAMATAGMGDVLSGVLAALQAHTPSYTIADAVALHALAGDLLAQGAYSIQAHAMPQALQQVMYRACNGTA